MTFQAKLLYLIAWILRIPTQSISAQTDLREDLNLDMLDIELMVFQLERYYHTEFTSDQINGIRTVQDIGNILRN
ncbi:MAG: phosphopantetheine-binding protein [Saprospiraceae bacterium]|nr:phosphopantetheine-binding protein [Saprospiraceae bacterium]